MPDEASASSLIDGVPPDAPGSREIGFSVPDRYNASAILFDNLMASGYRVAVTECWILDEVAPPRSLSLREVHFGCNQRKF